MKRELQTILHAICLVIFFSTFATNELFQSLEFLYATRLDSARVVKNVTRMIGEHKFIVDDMLASLAPCQWANEKKYESLTPIDGSSLTWSAVRSDSHTKFGPP
jgi:hypothetical protein